MSDTIRFTGRGYNGDVSFTLEGADNWLVEIDDKKLAFIDFSGHEFDAVSFNRCRVNNALFNNCGLLRCQFVDCCMYGVSFSGSEFTKTDFHNCQLSVSSTGKKSVFDRCDFIHCDIGNLAGMTFNNCRFQDCNFEKHTFDGAVIDGCVMDRSPISMRVGDYAIFITPTHLRIGCQLFTHQQWEMISEFRLATMDSYGMLPYWKTYGKALLALCRSYAAKKPN